MNSNIEKLKIKYTRSVNVMIVVGIYIFISTLLFFLFEKYTIPQILETVRWSDFLGLYINTNKIKYFGTFVSMLINSLIIVGCYLLARKSKQGDLRFYLTFLVIYSIDSFLSVFYFDLYSFILHLLVLGYLIYGHLSYTKLVVEYNKNKRGDMNDNNHH